MFKKKIEDYSDISELWEEVIVEDSSGRTYTFFKATDIIPSTHPRSYTRRFMKVVQDITGDFKDPKLENFVSIEPPCRTHLSDGIYCSNKYSEETPYTTKFEDWERLEICDSCDGTEFCLCGKHMRFRSFLEHKPTGKVLCVGSCCIRKINPELADIMEKSKCVISDCFNPLTNKNCKYQKEGYCSLKCLEKIIPNHELLKKCKECNCLLYEVSSVKLKGDFCSSICRMTYFRKKNNERVECKICDIKLKAKFWENHILTKTHIRNAYVEPVDDHARAWKEPEEEPEEEDLEEELEDEVVEVTVWLCRCEKYYIPEKYVKVRNPMCYICKIKSQGKPVTPKLKQWMIEKGLKHTE